MLRCLLAFLLAATVLGAGGYWLTTSYNVDSSPSSAPDRDIVHNASLEEKSEETLDQSLKSIRLSQGEGGFEIWRLKAEWANVMQQGDKVLVESPKLTYFDKDAPDKPLYVSSDKGDIEQKTQILRFVNNVRIIQEDRQMEGELLVYNGTAKTNTFPNGGRFAGTGMKGEAEHIIWNINDKIITRVGSINIFYNQTKDEKSPD